MIKPGNVCLLAFAVLGTLTAFAQNDQPGYFIRGEELFRQKQYYEAIQYYEKFLNTEIKITPRSQPFAVKKKTPKVAMLLNLRLKQVQVSPLRQLQIWA